ncbi:hypothetical protein PIB30_069270 [Stylosanthes scabra]|uniref:Uncharacterized protein n=1 Tax=Stylosanthes scabra TaxID=79078 RepID=A0ABU6UP75_9FABA|nr:hypothetical protein [Stylosanthes scabra]
MFNLNESSGGSNEGFNYGVDSEPLQGMLPEEFESHEGSAAGDPMTEPFHLDPDQDEGGDEVEEELNSFRISQVSLAQPAISQPVVNGTFVFHTAVSKKNERLGDTMALIRACKHQWGKITNGWTRRLLLVRFSQWSKQIQPSV